MDTSNGPKQVSRVDGSRKNKDSLLPDQPVPVGISYDASLRMKIVYCGDLGSIYL